MYTLATQKFVVFERQYLITAKSRFIGSLAAWSQ